MNTFSCRFYLQVTLSGASVGVWAACHPSETEASAPAALRFMVASDGYLGDPSTPSDHYSADLVTTLTQTHQTNPPKFVVINGNLVPGHDHTKDLGIMYGKTALLFDAHFGSSWGTAYRGIRLVEQSGEGFTTHNTTLPIN